MAPRTHRSARSIVCISPLLLAALACTPVPPSPDTESDENGPVEETLGRTLPATSGPLMFPPAHAGRRPRPALDIATDQTDGSDPNTG